MHIDSPVQTKTFFKWFSYNGSCDLSAAPGDTEANWQRHRPIQTPDRLHSSANLCFSKKIFYEIDFVEVARKPIRLPSKCRLFQRTQSQVSSLFKCIELDTKIQDQFLEKNNILSGNVLLRQNHDLGYSENNVTVIKTWRDVTVA